MNRRSPRAAARAVLSLAVLAAAGCQTQWYQVDVEEERVITNVVVRTVPAGATVYLNDRRMERAPVRIPMSYLHETSLWERQSNVGAQIRESTGIVGTILLFPVWLPASFFHTREELMRHVYGSNVHRLRARFDDGSESEKELRLEGEAEVEVEIAAPAAK